MYLKKPLTAQDLAAVRNQLVSVQEKLSAEPCCDWCGDPPVVVYAARRSSTGVFERCWRWMACAKCEALVDADDWDTIKVRTVARFKKFFGTRLPEVPDSLVREAVASALAQFHKYAIPYSHWKTLEDEVLIDNHHH
jgi:hypothetical protein